MRPLLMLLIFLPCFSLGQEKVFSWENKLADRQEELGGFTHTIIDEESNEFLSTLVTKNAVHRFFHRKNGNHVPLLQILHSGADSLEGFYRTVRETSQTKNLYWKNSFIGGVLRGNSIVEIVRNRFTYDFLVMETDVVSGSIHFTDTIRSAANERIIGCFNQEKKLYLLTYKTHQSGLFLYEKVPGLPLKKSELAISLAGFGKTSNGLLAASLKEFSDFFQGNDFAVFQNNLRYPVTITSLRNKIYIQKGKVIFSINSNNLNTYLIELDLRSAAYTIKTFDQDEGKNGSRSFAATTSLLIDSLLVTAHCEKEELKLNFFNTISGERIKKISITDQNIDSFSLAQVQKTGSFWSKSDLAKVSLKRFIHTAGQHPLGLTGYVSGNHLFLSFAAPYKQFLNGTDVLNIAFSAAGTYFINAAPDTYGYFISIFPKAKSPTYIGFDCSIDLTSISPSALQGNFTAWDRVLAFMHLHQGNIGRSDFFYMNGNYYIGFFDKVFHKFLIHRFDERGVE